MVLTEPQKLAVKHLLGLARRVSELELTTPVWVLELAADELTWQKMQVLELFD